MTDWHWRLGLGLILLTPALGATATPRVAQGKTAARAASPEDPLAKRLCDVLHALPAKRKQECCGTAVASLADLCTQELTASVRRGTVTLDSAGIDRCGVEAERQLAGCAWVTPLAPSRPAACGGLIGGKLRSGASCRSSLECGDGLFCRGLSPAGAGVCQPPAEASARCEAPADNLAAFARAKNDPRHAECKGRCVKGKCVPPTPAGEACVSSVLCAAGMNCIAGRCQALPLPTLGASCAGKTSCDAGAFCDAGSCRAVKEAGERCSMPFECRALACAKPKGQDTGTCADPCPAVGGRTVRH